MPNTNQLNLLKDLWNEDEAAQAQKNLLGLVRYRSNLLGSDLRITNFGGGNTSAKIDLPDPFSGERVKVLAVKGSGGDLGSITESGFAVLYLEKLQRLKNIYRGDEHEDEMVQYYPLAAFGKNRVAASIDTPLHAFLPFSHVDHLHPDWAIAFAASANGKTKLEEFNKQFGRKLIWVPWKRPGFELALIIERVVIENPGADGLILGSHGLFTWGESSQECYLNSINTIDEMGEFILDHQKRKEVLFGGLINPPVENRAEIACQILPLLRGLLSSNRRVIACYNDASVALTFAGSKWSSVLSQLGTSCPDHFLRTRICPLFVGWDPETEDVDILKTRIKEKVVEYRREYENYYEAWAEPESPNLRDTNPAVVIIPGLGLFSVGRNIKEARITAEFFINAINVIAGANALEDEILPQSLPQARTAEQSKQFTHFHNYVALPRSEAFRIEYWPLEEAKLKRMSPEGRFSRKILLVVGAASGIGREVALMLSRKGAHVVIADIDDAGLASVADEAAAVSTKELIAYKKADLTSSESLANLIKFTVMQFGGIDGVVNTAASYPVPINQGELSEAQWSKTFLINVTGNYLLARATRWVFEDQSLPATMVLTSSANAIVPKVGSEAYDTSKAALNQLVRELALKLSPKVRVNGIAPATVVTDSAMFPRDRVIQSLRKYNIEFSETASTEDLRAKLADFYAERSLTKRPVHPRDCANAILWLLSDESAKTTGHVLPVDGGLLNAFFR